MSIEDNSGNLNQREPNQREPGEYDAVLGGENPLPIHGAVLGGMKGAEKLIASENPEVQKDGLIQMTNHGKAGLFALCEVANDTNRTREIRNLAQSLLISARFSDFLPELISKFFLENTEFLESQKMAKQIKQNLKELKKNPKIVKFQDIKIMIYTTGFRRFKETGFDLVDPLGVAKTVGKLEEYEAYLIFSSEFDQVVEKMNFLKKQNEDNKPSLVSKISQLFTKKTEATLNWKGQELTQSDFQQKYEEMNKIDQKYSAQTPVEFVYSTAQEMENYLDEILFPQILQVLEIKKKSQRTLIKPRFISEFSSFIYSHMTKNPESFYLKPSDLVRKLEKLLDKIIEPKAEDFRLNILG